MLNFLAVKQANAQMNVACNSFDGSNIIFDGGLLGSDQNILPSFVFLSSG